MQHGSHDDDEQERRGGSGRREYDRKTPWPTYAGIAIAVLSIWWSTAVQVTNAQATRENVIAMQAQLNQMQQTGAQLRSAVDVINCKVGITCQPR